MSVVMGPEELRQGNGPDLAGVAPPSPGAISAQDDNSLLTPPPGSIGHQTKIRHRGTSWGHILDTVTNRLNGLIVAHASAHWYGAGPQATHGSYPTEAEGSGGGSLPMLGAGQDADGSLPTPLQHSAKRRERSNAPSRSQAPSESDVRRSRAEPRSAGDEVYLTDEGARLNEAMDALHNQSGDGCEEVRRRRTERAQAFTDSNSRCIQDMNQVGCVNCHGDIHDEPQLGDFNGLIPPPSEILCAEERPSPGPLLHTHPSGLLEVLSWRERFSHSPCRPMLWAAFASGRAWGPVMRHCCARLTPQQTQPSERRPLSLPYSS